MEKVGKRTGRETDRRKTHRQAGRQSRRKNKAEKTDIFYMGGIQRQTRKVKRETL